MRCGFLAEMEKLTEVYIISDILGRKTQGSLNCGCMLVCAYLHEVYDSRLLKCAQHLRIKLYLHAACAVNRSHTHMQMHI